MSHPRRLIRDGQTVGRAEAAATKAAPPISFESLPERVVFDLVTSWPAQWAHCDYLGLGLTGNQAASQPYNCVQPDNQAVCQPCNFQQLDTHKVARRRTLKKVPSAMATAHLPWMNRSSSSLQFCVMAALPFSAAMIWSAAAAAGDCIRVAIVEAETNTPWSLPCVCTCGASTARKPSPLRQPVESRGCSGVAWSVLSKRRCDGLCLVQVSMAVMCACRQQQTHAAAVSPHASPY